MPYTVRVLAVILPLSPIRTAVTSLVTSEFDVESQFLEST